MHVYVGSGRGVEEVKGGGMEVVKGGGMKHPSSSFVCHSE